MAKAKKTESKPSTAAKKKAATHKPAAPAGTPMIDTNLAAQSAARMLTAGINSSAPTTPNAPRQESSMFKQLKAGLNKTHSAAMSNLLDKSHGPEPTKIHPAMKQVGKNQTFGADVNRSGVPRRTPG